MNINKTINYTFLINILNSITKKMSHHKDKHFIRTHTTIKNDDTPFGP